MRGAWLAVLLAVPALSGCLSFLDDDDGERPAVAPADVGYDPATIRVTDVVRHAATIPSFDGTTLDAVAYEPRSADLTPDGERPRWGTVVFLHGFGRLKEEFEGAGGASGTPAPEDPRVEGSVNRLQAFAREGLVAIAYDARGHGRSSGTSTIAGPAELADLGAVLDWAAAQFPTNGLVGLVGMSYGGGQALQAWADDPRVTTAVPMYAWVDLYDGLVPGNVPKAQWAALLAGVGGGGTQGRVVSPMLAQWYERALTRSEMASIEAEMDQRSATGRMGSVAKPLFACQGMQETLFPQVDRVWQEAGGFTRAYVYTGGHGVQDEGCWALTLDWMRYFLAGHQTAVHAWPALVTVDASGARPVEYPTFPKPAWRGFYLDEPGLEPGYPAASTFTIEQRLLSNPFTEPSGVYEQLGQPANPLPEQFRQDPTAVFFETASLTGSEVLLGAAELTLVLDDPAGPLPFQVAGTLYHVDAGGRSRMLTRGAVAALAPDDLANGTATMRFDWVKADLAPGDRLVLKLGANDASAWMPLLSDYAVTFTGASQLRLPFFEG